MSKSGNSYLGGTKCSSQTSAYLKLFRNDYFRSDFLNFSSGRVLMFESLKYNQFYVLAPEQKFRSSLIGRNPKKQFDNNLCFIIARNSVIFPYW